MTFEPRGAAAPELVASQVRALEHVAGLAEKSGPCGPVDGDLRVTLNFHPDRLGPAAGQGGRGRRPVLELMAEAGVYVSQFVTGTSNGGLTAFVGGDRWRWESRMFGGAYDDAAAAERPVYGALNLWGDPAGGARRFGSSHLRLTPEVLRRSTFCYPDSSEEPTLFGVADALSRLVDAATDPADPRFGDPLDSHLEAHVHGPVRFDRDVEAVVLDVSYRGTRVEHDALRLGCPVEFHEGFRLDIDTMRRYPGFRGPRFVALGEQIAVDGWLDPRIIGDASRSGAFDDQDLKKVWHYVARFGSGGG